MRINWAKGEKCIPDVLCGEDIPVEDGVGTWVCSATGLKTAAAALAATMTIYSM